MAGRGLTIGRREASDEAGGLAAARLITGLLGLAAAPTFAGMAVLSVVSTGMADMCSVQAASPLTGMAAMYLLMSVFHLAPWLRRIGGRVA